MTDFTVRYTPGLNPHLVKYRIVRNPDYSGRVLSLNNWREYPIKDTRKQDLQDTLNKDIKEHGFRNPIIVYAIDEGIYLVFGGSRLRAAKLHNISIPAIVNDYTGDFRNYPEVTPENHLRFYTDEPCWHEFGEYGYDSHNGLERMRREEWSKTSTGFDWLKRKDYDLSFIEREMPWALDLVPDDTPKKSPK